MPKGVRATESRTITVSIDKALVEEIDAFAAAEKRSRSNWIVLELEKSVQRKRVEKISALPAPDHLARVAEHPDTKILEDDLPPTRRHRKRSRSIYGHKKKKNAGTAPSAQ